MATLPTQGVLCGDVDYCCLVCGETFTDEALVSEHILLASHAAGHAASGYVEAHAGERVRKIKSFYFCEACNAVLASSRKVSLHVSDETHEFNRSLEEGPSRGPFRRLGGAVVAFDDVLIEEVAWNGIVEDCCVLCDMDLDHVRAHVSEFAHVIKLIECKVNGGSSNSLYRKIENTLFQCLTCNAVISQNIFIAHWDSPEHTALHLKSRKAKRAADTNRIKLDPARAEILMEVQMKLEVENAAPSDDEEKHSKLALENQDTPKPEKSDDIGSKNNKNIVNEKENLAKDPLTLNTLNEIAKDSNEISKVNTKQNSLISAKKPVKTVKPNTSNEDISKYLYGHLDEELGTNSYLYINDHGSSMCVLCNCCMDPKDSQFHLMSPHHQMVESLHKEDLKRKNEKIKAAYMSQKEKENVVRDTISDKEQVTGKLSPSVSEIKCDEGSCSKLSPVVKMSSSSGTNDDNKKAVKKANETQNDVAAFELKAYEKNHIMCQDDSTKAFCQVCNTDLPALKKSLDEHIVGVKHKKNMNKSKVDVKSTKLSAKATANISDVNPGKAKDNPDNAADTLFQIVESPKVEETEKPYVCSKMEHFVVFWKLNLNFCIINNSICVNLLSYCLCHVTVDRDFVLMCSCCIMTMNPAVFEMHINGLSHKRKMAEIPVLISLGNEFVREVGADRFHCGFCHSFFIGWGALQNHLKGAQHRKEKAAAAKEMARHWVPIPVDVGTLTAVRAMNLLNGNSYFK